MIDSSRSHLADLPLFLTWQAGNTLADTAYTIHLNWTLERLHSWCDAGKQELWPAIAALPEATQKRFLLAPQLCYLLRSREQPGPRELQAVARFVQTEQYLCGTGTVPPREFSSTALGDYFLRPKEAGGPPDILKLPVIRNIVFNTCNPYSSAWWPTDPGKLEKYNREEASLLQQQIEHSLCHIDSVSIPAMHMIETSLQVIAAVKIPEQADSCCSTSERKMIGSAGLGNFHVKKWGAAKLADSLVHEAIHSLIYKLELAEDLYTDEIEASSQTVVSPWSGRLLSVDAFVHACFVWFGLLNFWCLDRSEEPAARDLREHAKHGFRQGPVLSKLSSQARDCIRPQVQSVLEEMGHIASHVSVADMEVADSGAK